MTKIRILTISVIVLLLLNAGMLVYLFSTRRPAEAARRETAAAYITAQLKLDAQQQQDYAELLRQHHKAIRAANDEDVRLHRVYFTLFETDHPDSAKVDSVINLIGAQKQEIEHLTFNHFQKLRHLLSPEQKKLFNSIINEIFRRMAPPRPGRRPPGDGPGPGPGPGGPPAPR